MARNWKQVFDYSETPEKFHVYLFLVFIFYFNAFDLADLLI